VAVANKVQTLDGRWLSIDGRVLFEAKVAASETYNTSLEQHLRDTLAVRFAARPGTDPSKRPVREIVGVDPLLNQRWSTRRALINLRRGELAIQFQQDHGRPPTPVEALQLAQQATLETPETKQEPRSLAEQRTTWMNQASAVLGGPGAVASMVRTALAPPAETATIADSHWVAQTAGHILTVMEASRSPAWPTPCPSTTRSGSPSTVVRVSDWWVMINNSPRSVPAACSATSRTLTGALQLAELHRFTDPAEAEASLALREGDPDAIGFYLDHGRVHVGDLAKITEDAFAAWISGRAAGLDAIMLAPTRELVADLNRRAREHRLDGAPVGQEVRLGDGNRASVGDVIITRTNDRRLRLVSNDWVKNGDRWIITHVDRSGGLTVRHSRSQLTVRLPADYVHTSTGLGFATTIHSAQGVSTDTMHGLLTGPESRQQLYTMLTRGQAANHLYLQVVGDGDPHTLIRPETVAPRSPTELLEQILARDDTPTSATKLLRQLSDPAAQLLDAVERYTDGLNVAAEQLTGLQIVHPLDGQAGHIVPGLTREQSWPTL
jgi:TrwC relaxase/AAA domain